MTLFPTLPRPSSTLANGFSSSQMLGRSILCTSRIQHPFIRFADHSLSLQASHGKPTNPTIPSNILISITETPRRLQSLWYWKHDSSKFSALGTQTWFHRRTHADSPRRASGDEAWNVLFLTRMVRIVSPAWPVLLCIDWGFLIRFNPDAGPYGFGTFPGHLARNAYDESKVEPYTGWLPGKDYLRDIQLAHMKTLAHTYETEIMVRSFSFSF
jgi:hypothetical protein